MPSHPLPTNIRRCPVCRCRKDKMAFDLNVGRCNECVASIAANGRTAEVDASRAAAKACYHRRKHVYRKRREDNKALAIQAYGGACACCGERAFPFLTIDHVFGGGGTHRRSVAYLPTWLVNNGFPSGFRVLCMNCNFALGRFGFCPHSAGETMSEGGANQC